MVDPTTITLGIREWLEQSLEGTIKELERLNNCYLRLDGKMDVLADRFSTKVDVTTKDLNCKIETTDKRITNLYIKVAGLSSAVAILTALCFKYLVK